MSQPQEREPAKKRRGGGKNPAAPGGAPATAADLPTRERVIAAALEVFYRRGTFAASMRELAGAAGLSVQGLYYHFESKDEVVRAVIEEAGLKASSPGPDLPPDVEGRVVARANAEFDAFVANPVVRGLLAMEAVRRQPDALKAVALSAHVWRREWAEVVLGQASDLRPDVDLEDAATFATTFLWGVNIEYVMTLDESLRARLALLGNWAAQTLSLRSAQADALAKPAGNHGGG
jgi:AcrR family transcriptional regulator